MPLQPPSHHHARVEQVLFSLIRSALGSADSLPFRPDGRTWRDVLTLAQRQAVTGIAFAGIRRLTDEAAEDYAGMSEAQYCAWLSHAAQIAQRNQQLTAQCHTLQLQLQQAGLRCCILKGQGLGKVYGPLAPYRQTGDIDVAVACSRQQALAYARHAMGRMPRWDYKHLHLEGLASTHVELHYRPEVLSDLVRNRRLQRWFAAHREAMYADSYDGLTVPTAEFNAVYILVHAYQHFVMGGIGLRQLMDCHLVLQACAGLPSEQRHEVLRVLRNLGMRRFVQGLMWTELHVFAAAPSVLIDAPNPTEGRFLLSEAMAGGNFGHYDRHSLATKGGSIGYLQRTLRHGLHLLRRYPVPVLWIPLYLVWHFAWKSLASLSLRFPKAQQ